MSLVAVLSCLGFTTAQACSPDQYTIANFTPAIGHWQDEHGQETGERQPTFSGRIASQCRTSGTVEIEIIGRDAAGHQVQQALTTVRNVGPAGADFDFTTLLPYDARAVRYDAAIIQIR